MGITETCCRRVTWGLAGGPTRGLTGCPTRGLTLIELVIAVAVLSILATLAMPLAENSVRRTREMALRENLRKMRRAIDRYYDKADKASPGLPEEEKYPKSLEELVEKKFLRRVPKDPVTGEAEWLILSYTDTFDEDYFIPNENPENVYDVRSASEDTALDGTRYMTW